MKKKLTITCISDCHTLHRQLGRIKKTDVLVFAGDFMNSGYIEEEVFDFLDWFSSQPHTYKVMIAGNHDHYAEKFPNVFRSILENYSDVIYLEDKAVEIEGLKFYGTPHSKHFANWAFNKSEDRLEDVFELIPLDTDVLISHAPPYLTLDGLVDGGHVGEFTLAKRIEKLNNLKLHVFGHVHAGAGMLNPHEKHISVNASQVNEYYELVNFPIVIPIQL